MKLKSILIILLSCLTMAVFAQQKKVAVYVTGNSPEIHDVFGHQISEAFAKSGRYIATERTESFLAELGKEHNYERTGAVDDKEIARLGIQFGVNYVCVAKISDAFGEKYIAARLIDVETAEIVNSHYVKGPMTNMDQCVTMADEIATYLSKGSFAEQAAEANEMLKKQGYVDLGLPSGTWWKENNEDECYQLIDAVKKYGKSLPTKEQFLELFENCDYEITHYSGFHDFDRKDSDKGINIVKFTSKINGASIYFQTGCSSGCYNFEGRNFEGWCWSRTSFYQNDYDGRTLYAWGLSWFASSGLDTIKIEDGQSCYWGSAHLVKNPEQ